MVKFIIIGMTDNPQPQFPPEVANVIARGRVFSGGRRHHEMVAGLLPDDSTWIDITVPIDNVFVQYRALPDDSVVTVFASGDPLFFGFAATIRHRWPAAEIEVLPTFNSLQLLAHRLSLPYGHMRVVSLTGRPWNELDRALIERVQLMGILTDRHHTPAAIARRMLDYGYLFYSMAVGERLGNPERERVARLSLEEAAQTAFDMPCCVILEGVKEYDCRGERKEERGERLLSEIRGCGGSEARPFGIPDDRFALLNGREKMITKMPVRLLTLQALDLSGRHVLWDVGFCTGSVSIEARLLMPHLQVVAFERRPECEAIIADNARRLGAPGIEVHMGDFLQTDCEGIATPDAVFIGGHGGRLKDVMRKVWRHLAPGGVIVMNCVEAPAVTTDSKRLFAEACQELGLQMERPRRIVVDDYHPITILKCRK